MSALIIVFLAKVVRREPDQVARVLVPHRAVAVADLAARVAGNAALVSAEVAGIGLVGLALAEDREVLALTVVVPPSTTSVEAIVSEVALVTLVSEVALVASLAKVPQAQHVHESLEFQEVEVILVAE